MNLRDKIETYVESTDVDAAYSKHISHFYARYLESLGLGQKRFVDSTEHHLIDADGQRYLDLVAGYGTCHWGRHPAVQEALCQLHELHLPSLVQFQLPVLSTMLAEEILDYAGSRYERLFFTNGGAEATEYTLKMARAVTGRQRMLCFEGGYHGLTLGALSINGMEAHQKLFSLQGENPILPFGDLDAVEDAFRRHPKQIAGVFLEPVQGRTGEVASPEFTQGLRQLCDRHGALLVFDEIKTGFGRTGKRFSYEWHDVLPDVVTIAKGISGGETPVGAVLYSAEVYRKIYGLIDRIAVWSSTFKENNLSMAVGLAVMELYRDNPQIHDHVLAAEARVRERLEGHSQDRYRLSVGGRGLLLTVRIEHVDGKKWVHSLMDTLEGDLFYDMVCRQLFTQKQILVSLPNRFGASLALIPALNLPLAEFNRNGQLAAAAFEHLGFPIPRPRAGPRRLWRGGLPGLPWWLSPGVEAERPGDHLEIGTSAWCRGGHPFPRP